MKKNMILAAICIILSTAVANAKSSHQPHEAPNAQPRVEQTFGQHRDAIDMSVIRELHLSHRKYQKVEELNRKISARHSNIDYRHELREILGKKDYNAYMKRVEKQKPIMQPKSYHK